MRSADGQIKIFFVGHIGGQVILDVFIISIVNLDAVFRDGKIGIIAEAGCAGNARQGQSAGVLCHGAVGTVHDAVSIPDKHGFRNEIKRNDAAGGTVAGICSGDDFGHSVQRFLDPPVILIKVLSQHPVGGIPLV